MRAALLHAPPHGVRRLLDDLKQFRQLGSKTPGHPENTHTPGVEVATGPLGQGIANGVGMALGQAHMAGTFNRPGFDVVDNYTFVICGDGCLQEGVSSEASSLAGHLGLGRLIVLYDDNKIQIDGSTDLAIGASHDGSSGTRRAGSVFLTLLNRDGAVRESIQISNGMGGLGDVLAEMNRSLGVVALALADRVTELGADFGMHPLLTGDALSARATAVEVDF